MTVEVFHGDCLEVIPRLVSEGRFVDAAITDPPYHLTATQKRFGAANSAPAQYGRDGAMARLSGGFMGQRWDGGDIAFRPETWATVATILRPGAFLLAFGGTRTYHRLACAIEDAGFVIQDSILDLISSDARVQRFLATLNDEQVAAFSAILDQMQPGGALFWGFGQGFPKRRDALKPAYEQIVCAYRPGGKRTLQINECRILFHDTSHENSIYNRDLLRICDPRCCIQRTLREWAEYGSLPSRPFFSDAEYVRSWSSALVFPADCLSCRHSRDELIRLARESVLACAPLQRGAPADIDHLRIEWQRIRACLCIDHRAIWGDFLGCLSSCTCSTNLHSVQEKQEPPGRWPANVVHDGSDEVLAAFPNAKGAVSNGSREGNGLAGTKTFAIRPRPQVPGRNDNGSAARFYYHAKADVQDRAGSKHPTVKSVDLISWLVKLVTPPGGLFIDPFAGSGTAGTAAVVTGRSAILIEREPKYVADIRERLAALRSEATVAAPRRTARRSTTTGDLLSTLDDGEGPR
jgi:DNA modification methylase